MKIEVLHGLGNRLITLSTCMMLATPPKKIYWNKSWHCQSSFDDVIRIQHCPFSIVSSDDFEAPLIPRPIPESKLPPCFKAWNVFITRPNRYALKSCAKRIQPSISVSKRVESFFNAIPGGAKNCIGVHIRRGDVAAKQESLRSVDDYIKTIKKIKRRGQCIIIASDDDTMLQKFKNIFGSCVYRAANNTNRESSFEAAVDLFALVKCRTFIPSPESSFSQFIQWRRR